MRAEVVWSPGSFLDMIEAFRMILRSTAIYMELNFLKCVWKEIFGKANEIHFYFGIT